MTDVLPIYVRRETVEDGHVAFALQIQIGDTPVESDPIVASHFSMREHLNIDMTKSEPDDHTRAAYALRALIHQASGAR
jgi:hypothetical protein